MKTFAEYNKNTTVDVFAICFNEEFILPHFIKHYYKNFKANITIFDNQSTDNSVRIAKDMGCSVRRYDSGNQINDHIYLQIKNSCWKNSKANFVIVCDLDEFIETPFNCQEYTIINTKGYDVIGEPDNRMGAPNPAYNKAAMFSPKHIQEMNYTPGCHNCNPVGAINGSKEFATLLHRKYISPEYVLQKHLVYQQRLSEFNKQYGFGVEYQNVTEENINAKFEELAKNAIYIP